jgi:DNA helicase-2/ATP-dependent DNA helicase PcrA
MVKGFELGLRVLANPNDRLHLGMLSKLWSIPVEEVPWGDSDAILKKIRGAARDAQHTTVLDAIDKLRSNVKNPPMLDSLELLAKSAEKNCAPEEFASVSLDTTVWRNHWDVFLRNQSGGIPEISAFISQVALGSTQQPRQEGIALLTVHSAKGLEFDVVFVCGMTEGTFPDYRAKEGAALEEERRNAFVAVTRSKRLLFLSYPKEKEVPWGTQTPKRSRFIDMICTSKP